MPKSSLIKLQKLSSGVVVLVTLFCFLDILFMSNLEVLPELIEPMTEPMIDPTFQ